MDFDEYAYSLRMGERFTEQRDIAKRLSGDADYFERLIFYWTSRATALKGNP